MMPGVSDGVGMGMVTVESLFNGPWGIVESRRDEIESGAHGAFGRVYEEEVARNFLPIGKVAELLGCHEDTARKRLHQADARYIKRSLAHLYFKADAEAVKARRAAAKAERAA